MAQLTIVVQPFILSVCNYPSRFWGWDMRGILLAGCAALLLSGCVTSYQSGPAASMSVHNQQVLLGVLAGAGAGALIAAAAASGGGPIVVAAVAGGAGGGVIASFIRPNNCYFVNKRGELWQIPCEQQPASAMACFYGSGPGMLTQIDCPHGDRRRQIAAAAVDK
jgi:hypothetical protein